MSTRLQPDELQELGDRLRCEFSVEKQAMTPEIERCVERLHEKELLKQTVQTLYILEGELRSCMPRQLTALEHVEQARSELTLRLNEIEPLPIIPAPPPVTDPEA